MELIQIFLWKCIIKLQLLPEPRYLFSCNFSVVIFQLFPPISGSVSTALIFNKCCSNDTTRKKENKKYWALVFGRLQYSLGINKTGVWRTRCFSKRAVYGIRSCRWRGALMRLTISQIVASAWEWDRRPGKNGALNWPKSTYSVNLGQLRITNRLQTSLENSRVFHKTPRLWQIRPGVLRGVLRAGVHAVRVSKQSSFGAASAREFFRSAGFGSRGQFFIFYFW